MFQSLAKRLTAWYVFVAMTLIVLVVGASSVFSFTLFARATNEAEESVARVVRDYETRAKNRHQTFPIATRALLSRIERPDLRVRIFPPNWRSDGSDKGVIDTHRIARDDRRA